CQHYKNFPYTF
nr:immunoglobulin light chain junction region [Macaca mulatta]MOX07844.1 immunoglobulin light chain junction region [Macaca mulatta]MOX08827.1 immunoglobulin light chain junction region [Macaca mulatta]MOX09043.1 immunoglobulin light chain junction region [Macaca mulatta]MOX10576.1 immunoglobulin light chain junction region [Macaca mulatta]